MRQIFALLVVFVLGTTSSHADDAPYVPKTVPPCRMFKTALGVDVCGYDDIEDWKKVLVIDVEVVHLRTQLKNEQDKGIDLLEMKKLHLAEIQALSDSQKTLTEQNSKLTQDLIALDEKYQNERVKPMLGSPIAWTIAAVSTSILVGFVVHEALR
jgi:hypothetical protein